MLNKDFYAILDKELAEKIEYYKEEEAIKRHPNAPEQQKAYGFLIWFLEFYAGRYNFKDYITEGNADRSCDIVVDFAKNGHRVFYIVQSKWTNPTKKNKSKSNTSDEIKKALSDFDTILKGNIENVNPRLQKKLIELDEHRKNNGEVKFIFLTLADYKGQAQENIEAFKQSDPQLDFEVIDFGRIKKDYIDREYKKIKPLNPLQKNYNPKEEEINLDIIPNNNAQIDRPYQAYILLLRPKTIWQLFDKYGFSLFFKNVRNPLIASQFNQQIKETLLDNPASFWYYNNGITAITRLLPTIGTKAEKIAITGLQIINGAQTVYAIYSAYQEATFAQRKKMDAEAHLTFRLMNSGGVHFDLDVTRYTNSQNPITDRDFVANDPIQVRLQKASFETNVWYEKRRGEFREVPEGVKVVSNEEFAKAYLAYELESQGAIFILFFEGKGVFDVEKKGGVYDSIFNRKSISFQDMLCAYKVNLDNKKRLSSILKIPIHKIGDLQGLVFLAFVKIVIVKYIQEKYNPNIDVNSIVLEKLNNGETEFLYKIYSYAIAFSKIGKNLLSVLTHGEAFQPLRDGLIRQKNIVEEIDNIKIPPIEEPNP